MYMINFIWIPNPIFLKSCIPYKYNDLLEYLDNSYTTQLSHFREVLARLSGPRDYRENASISKSQQKICSVLN